MGSYRSVALGHLGMHTSHCPGAEARYQESFVRPFPANCISKVMRSLSVEALGEEILDAPILPIRRNQLAIFFIFDRNFGLFKSEMPPDCVGPAQFCFPFAFYSFPYI